MIFNRGIPWVICSVRHRYRYDEQEEYEVELEAVEDVSLQEREALLAANKVCGFIHAS